MDWNDGWMDIDGWMKEDRVSEQEDWLAMLWLMLLCFMFSFLVDVYDGAESQAGRCSYLPQFVFR